MNSNLRICLFGATGRMGREILSIVSEPEAEGSGVDSVIGGVVGEGDSSEGMGVAGIEHLLTTNWVESYSSANVIIDFSSPVGTELALTAALEFHKPLVVGTTGLSEHLGRKLSAAASEIPVLYASNFSVGMNVLFLLAKRSAQMLGESFDFEIVELHHKMKQDAPSGSAISLGESVAKGTDNATKLKTSRSGKEALRENGEICLHSVRGGDVVGEHTAYFFGKGERIELTHRATDRAIFARGAIRAARWLVAEQPGYYSMIDVLDT